MTVIHELRRVHLMNQELVSEIPARLVTGVLGYSDQITQKHAAEAGNPWAKYVQRSSQMQSM